ncbi:MAG: hypothetical protein AAFO97_07350 [Pseudomonadota bacterium]
MTPVQRTLLAIVAFVTLAVGSFIYFIANWDSSKAEPIGALNEHGTQQASLFSDSKKSRGLGQRPSPAFSSSGT